MMQRVNESLDLNVAVLAWRRGLGAVRRTPRAARAPHDPRGAAPPQTMPSRRPKFSGCSTRMRCCRRRTQLQITDDQYTRFLARFKALQDARRKALRSTPGW